MTRVVGSVATDRAAGTDEGPPAAGTGRGHGRLDFPARPVPHRMADVLAVLDALVGGAVLLLDGTVHRAQSPAVIWADATAGVLCAGALWWRRRWPLAITVVATAAAGFTDMAGAPAIVALLTLAVHRRWPEVAAATVLHIVATAVYYEVRPLPGQSYSTAVISTVLLATCVVAWGMFVRARRQLVSSLHERVARAESEQRLRVEQARHLERTRIAGDARRPRPPDLPAEHACRGAGVPAGRPTGGHRRAAGVIRDSAHAALQDVRDVIGVLREVPGDGSGVGRPQPTLADVPALIEESRRAGGRVPWVSGSSSACPGTTCALSAPWSALASDWCGAATSGPRCT